MDWKTLFSGEEARAYEAQRGGAQRSPGRRPALLVVDVTRAFTGEPDLTLEESVAVWPTSCGPYAWEALPHIRSLLDFWRERDLPVVFTTGSAESVAFGGTVKGEVVTGSAMAREGALDIPPRVKPRSGELVLAKHKPSAFFGTPLVAYLHQHRVDSLVVAGATTSGCVRATVVDGHSYGWPVHVVADAVFDRAVLSHQVSLYEMDAKYADVVTGEELDRLWSAAAEEG